MSSAGGGDTALITIKVKLVADVDGSEIGDIVQEAREESGEEDDGRKIPPEESTGDISEEDGAPQNILSLSEQRPFKIDNISKEDDAIQNAIQQAITSDIDEAVDTAGKRTSEDKPTSKDTTTDNENVEKAIDLVRDMDHKGIANVRSLASSPQSFIGQKLLRALSSAGPYGALAAAIITSIAAAPEMVKAVVSALGVKGAILNQDYKYSLEGQENLHFDRVTQFRKLTGDDAVITSRDRGFVVGDADFTLNSLVDVSTGRVGRINLRQTSLGYAQGV